MKNKGIDPKALDAIMAKSDVKEQGAVSQAEEQNVDTAPVQAVIRRRKRTEYRTFSVSLEINEYNKWQMYLINNDIKSGSALIRDLLKENGIL